LLSDQTKTQAREQRCDGTLQSTAHAAMHQPITNERYEGGLSLRCKPY
jgi:hypothetical protein